MFFSLKKSWPWTPVFPIIENSKSNTGSSALVLVLVQSSNIIMARTACRRPDSHCTSQLLLLHSFILTQVNENNILQVNPSKKIQ